MTLREFVLSQLEEIVPDRWEGLSPDAPKDFADSMTRCFQEFFVKDVLNIICEMYPENHLIDRLKENNLPYYEKINGKDVSDGELTQDDITNMVFFLNAEDAFDMIVNILAEPRIAGQEGAKIDPDVDFEEMDKILPGFQETVIDNLTTLFEGIEDFAIEDSLGRFSSLLPTHEETELFEKTTDVISDAAMALMRQACSDGENVTPEQWPFVSELLNRTISNLGIATIGVPNNQISPGFLKCKLDIIIGLAQRQGILSLGGIAALNAELQGKFSMDNAVEAFLQGVFSAAYDMYPDATIEPGITIADASQAGNAISLIDVVHAAYEEYAMEHDIINNNDRDDI